MLALHQVLAPGGEVRIKTDDQPYFLWIEKVIGRAKGFERASPGFATRAASTSTSVQRTPARRALAIVSRRARRLGTKRIQR